MKAIYRKYLRFNSKRVGNFVYRHGLVYRRNLAAFRSFLAGLDGMPIILPVFNNHFYVAMMLEQLERHGLLARTVVFDNRSTHPDTRRYLREIEPRVKVIYLRRNVGPRFLLEDKPYYGALPETFCLSDPDLEFNAGLPGDFLAQLEEITRTWRASRAGFALDVSNPAELIQQTFRHRGRDYHIWDWENMFWERPLGTTPEGDCLYAACIDTTFAVHNKRFSAVPNSERLDIRVAGRFTCRHLPWYRERQLPPEQEEAYRKTQRWSFYHRHLGCCRETSLKK
jgi:hypothetical protein